MNRFFVVVLLYVTLGFSSASGAGFTLTSPELGGQLSEAQVYSGNGCSGKNISPVLNWSNAPQNTKSFAVTLYDPDAPTGSGWWHWVIFNVPVTISELKRDAGNLQKMLAPKGSIQSVTDWGIPGFGGACPPKGDKAHRYIFTLYALDVEKLEADEKTLPATAGFLLNRHVIAKASLISYYGR